MKNSWQLTLRRAHLLVLRSVVIDKMGSLEARARNPRVYFTREEREELDVLREIYEQLEEKS